MKKLLKQIENTKEWLKQEGNWEYSIFEKDSNVGQNKVYMAFHLRLP
jgi:hypothetical protein